MTAIEFENISKQYRLGLVSSQTISHDLKRWWTMNVLGKEDPLLKIGETKDRSTKGESEYVWALKDISFKVEQGEACGIIGKNGSGKSTLLKILSKIILPTTGLVRTKGRITSLLEVGTGFHPELTGRENIYLNGSILGMSRQEINKKLDEIIAFSEIERYIDTPVKRYSSGMKVRLGFSVAAHLDAEILILDEVLAVGDSAFRKKSMHRMQEIIQIEGRTLLFVSHSMSLINNICDNCIMLENGQITKMGEASDVSLYYLKNNHSSKDFKPKIIVFELPDTGLCVTDFSISQNEVETTELYQGEDTYFNLTVHNQSDETFTPWIQFNIMDMFGEIATNLGSQFQHNINISIAPKSKKKLSLKIKELCWKENEYSISLCLCLPQLNTRWIGFNDIITIRVNPPTAKYLLNEQRSWGFFPNPKHGCQATYIDEVIEW